MSKILIHIRIYIVTYTDVSVEMYLEERGGSIFREERVCLVSS